MHRPAPRLVLLLALLAGACHCDHAVTCGLPPRLEIGQDSGVDCDIWIGSSEGREVLFQMTSVRPWTDGDAPADAGDRRPGLLVVDLAPQRRSYRFGGVSVDRCEPRELSFRVPAPGSVEGAEVRLGDAAVRASVSASCLTGAGSEKPVLYFESLERTGAFVVHAHLKGAAFAVECLPGG